MTYEELQKISKGKSGGWLSEKDKRWLTLFISSLQYDYEPVMVEIGVFQGGSSLIFLIAQPKGRFYAVDNFLGGPHSHQFKSLKDGFEVTTNDYKDRITICHGDSKAIGKRWRERIDILFIDGCHDGDYPKADMENFIPYVKKNGYIIIDDYGMPNVRKYADGLRNNTDFKLIAEPNETSDLVAFQKLG